MAALGGAAGALVVGCSALVSLDGLTGPADAASAPSEASPSPDATVALDSGDKDASPATDAAPDADTHVGPNLIEDSTFETKGCTWRSFQGTIATDSTARSGTKSCRVCPSPSTTDYFTGGDPFSAPAPTIGTTYHASAWVRTAPGAATPPGAIFFMRTSNATPFTQVEGLSTDTAVLPFTDTWQKMELTLKVTKAAEQMDIFVGTDTAPGACFLIDDVWLERLP